MSKKERRERRGSRPEFEPVLSDNARLESLISSLGRDSVEWEPPPPLEKPKKVEPKDSVEIEQDIEEKEENVENRQSKPLKYKLTKKKKYYKDSDEINKYMSFEGDRLDSLRTLFSSKGIDLNLVLHDLLFLLDNDLAQTEEERKRGDPVTIETLLSDIGSIKTSYRASRNNSMKQGRTKRLKHKIKNNK